MKSRQESAKGQEGEGRTGGNGGQVREGDEAREGEPKKGEEQSRDERWEGRDRTAPADCYSTQTESTDQMSGW